MIGEFSRKQRRVLRSDPNNVCIHALIDHPCKNSDYNCVYSSPAAFTTVAASQAEQEA